jgi:hypothetical protein
MSDHRISRRTVLRAGALGAVATAVPIGAIELFADRLLPANTWTMGQFSKLRGTTFEVGAARTPLQLLRVTDMRGGASANGTQQSYALTFTGPRSPRLANTQAVRHSQLAPFQMFLVDGGVSDGEQHYTAVVNRI